VDYPPPSVFDLLYKQNTKERIEFLSKHKSISDELSENLLYGKLTDIIQQHNLVEYDIRCHYPLSRLVSISKDFTEEERTFVGRSWSHVDFLIYRPSTLEPVFVIEVDGYRWHKEKSEQKRRDNLKNSILEKCSIPILRLSTVGSREDEKILAQFKKIKEAQ